MEGYHRRIREQLRRKDKWGVRGRGIRGEMREYRRTKGTVTSDAEGMRRGRRIEVGILKKMN
jgi:hypothetical protein